MRMLALDLDGTLLGNDGQVSPRNLRALQAAERRGVEIALATGRRHGYAMQPLRGLGLSEENVLISSNGAVTRTLGARLLHRTLLPRRTAEWLCGQLESYRRSLLVTFDRVGPNGEDSRGAMAVEDLAELNARVSRWVEANGAYIEQVVPIERALGGEGLIQMMLCGPVERMRAAEALLLKSRKVQAVGLTPPRGGEARDARSTAEADEKAEAALHRTEYPERDLSIVDILPAGCGKGTALLRLAAARGIEAGDILALGDNWNDVSMLEAAGSAALMGNAPDDLKDVGRRLGWRIGARHDEDGAARVVEEALES